MACHRESRQRQTAGPQPIRARHRREAGFSLMELLVALTVTVIGMTGLMTLHVTTLKGNRSASKVTEATSLCERTLEEMRGRSIADIEAEFGTLPISSATLPNIIGRAGQNYRPSMSVTEVSTDFIRFRMEMAWTDDGAVPGSENGRYDHVVRLESIRTRQDAP